jgi:hypothetical protein
MPGVQYLYNILQINLFHKYDKNYNPVSLKTGIARHIPDIFTI